MLKILTFGDPQLVDDDGARVESMERRSKGLALLVYLACGASERQHRRDEVTSVFWPESDGPRGRNALRQTLHIIRRELGPGIVHANGNEDLAVNRQNLSCDVTAFTRAIADGLPETALAYYKDDFLLGFNLQGCPDFDSWADERRTDLRKVAASAARDLAHQAEGREDSSTAIFWWRRARRHQPYDEFIIRRIGSLLAWSENRGVALAEMEAFRKRMIADLETEPSPKTLELMERLAAGQMEEVVQWFGDRRGTWKRTPEPHLRRPSDQK
ncbi:MAG: BTAD domain-containing putative transcriptional regulator [Gemmatimonadota bacterium]